MLIIRTNAMPRLWWLNPWATARYLFKCLNAVKAYADRMDRIDDIQRGVIDDQSKEIKTLRRQLAQLAKEGNRP